MPPVWDKAGDERHYPALHGDATADIVIIGAGYTGLVAALEARAAGLSVTVLESEQPGAGASGANAGHFVPFILAGPDPAKLIRKLGERRAEQWLRLIAGSGRWLVACIEEHEISCDLRKNYLCVARSDRSVERMRAKFDAWNAYGGRFDMIDRAALREHVGSSRYAGGLWLPEGGTLQPRRLADGLAKAAGQKGIGIFGNSRVLSALYEGKGWVVTTASGTVRAKRLLVATGATNSALFPALQGTTLGVVAATLATETLADGGAIMLPRGGSVVDLDDKAVFSPTIDGRKRLVASVLCQGRIPILPDAATPLMRRLDRAFPHMEHPPFTSLSFGRMTMTPDGLPRILRVGENGWSVSGCNGMGLTQGIAAAREAARLLAGTAEADLALPVREPKRVFAAKALEQLMRMLMVPALNRLSA